VAQSQAQLVRALGTQSITPSQIIEAVNQRRTVLNLEPLQQLLADSSLKAGLAAAPTDQKSIQRIPKKQALAELAELSAKLTSSEPANIAKGREQISEILGSLLNSPSLLRSLHRQDFLRTGLELIDGDSCPFCDTAWIVDQLRQHVLQSLDEAEQAAALRTQMEKAAAPIAGSLRQIEILTTVVSGYARQLKPPIDNVELDRWSATLKLRRETILKLENLEASLSYVSSDYRQLPEAVVKSLADIRHSVEQLPDPTKEEEAKEYLTLCQERLDVFRRGKRKQAQNKSRSDLAAKILDAYNATVTGVLNKIYGDVAKDFGRFYRFINRDDEAEFEGKLTPSAGMLSFDVDFYKRGSFPPAAYHSEGHQDAMGLCLYLALMKHTLEQKFSFAVLDDVLMSVDAGHRREVCALLKSEFPQTQFLVTTHDEIWLRHMMTEKLIAPKAFVHFRKWTVDDGPLVWDGTDAWQEIDESLSLNRIPQAAGTLRRYLEYVGRHLSERLRAKIEFRGDAQYDLGELLTAIIQAWRDLLSRAKAAANSWNKKDDLERLTALHDEFNRRVEKSQVEQWPMNASIHFNEWDNFQKQDFTRVVEAFKELLRSFSCTVCATDVYVLPPRGSREQIRCDCGDFSFNLKARS
jgi:hypothetical protein